MITRREFLRAGGIGGLSALVPAARLFAHTNPPSARPMIVASLNGARAIETTMEMLQRGSDALDAVIAGASIVEDDPKDDSVGYGGLPNEDGVVELDAAVMHGPTHRGGAVAALRNIKNASRVARTVMERTDHVLLVGEGALRFAKAHGYKEENLLTEESREKWLKWKETLSNQDDRLPPHSVDDEDIGSFYERRFDHHGTIHISALDGRGNLSCVTSTSGLAYKIPGRVGDSPILGAGLYVDNEVGSAGSTGRGEANLLNCSCVMVVEWMRQGRLPEEACLLACRRIVDHNREKRHLDKDGRYRHNVRFYAINKRGEYGCASIWGGAKAGPDFVIHDGTKVQKLTGAFLYERK